PTPFILFQASDYLWMVGDLGSEILYVRDTDHTGNEFSAFAVKSNANHTVASSSVTAAYVDLCATTKLPRSGFRFISTLTKRAFAFDVCNDAPNSVSVFHCVFSHCLFRNGQGNDCHLRILQSAKWHNSY
ncbi:MAG: hypothetical protein AAFZ49_12130, partial [Cyanobacteria bacterium J06659_2]